MILITSMQKSAKIAKENTQNDVLNFEQFDAEEEDNDECNKVVDV